MNIIAIIIFCLSRQFIQVKPRVAAPAPLRPNNMNGPGGKLQQVAARFASGNGHGPGGGPRPPR